MTQFYNCVKGETDPARDCFRFWFLATFQNQFWEIKLPYVLLAGEFMLLERKTFRGFLKFVYCTTDAQIISQLFIKNSSFDVFICLEEHNNMRQ